MFDDEVLNLKFEDTYESVAAEYQYQMIKVLDASMKKQGITKATRKAVCEDFAFDFGMLHDQGEIKLAGSKNSNGRQFEPIIAFRENGDLYLVSEFFAWHEYAFGNVDEAIGSVDKNMKLQASDTPSSLKTESPNDGLISNFIKKIKGT